MTQNRLEVCFAFEPSSQAGELSGHVRTDSKTRPLAENRRRDIRSPSAVHPLRWLLKVEAEASKPQLASSIDSRALVKPNHLDAMLVCLPGR